MVEHPSLSSLEVVDTKEQPDSTCVLVADGIDLSIAVGLGEEQAGLRLRRSDDDPTLRTSIVRGRRRVLDEIEPQCIDEEADGVVVVLDDQRRVLDVHSWSPQAIAGLISEQTEAATRRAELVSSSVG